MARLRLSNRMGDHLIGERSRATKSATAAANSKQSRVAQPSPVTVLKPTQFCPHNDMSLGFVTDRHRHNVPRTVMTPDSARFSGRHNDTLGYWTDAKVGYWTDF